MNVENRKLFANRDARKRLAEMGGILASSPELMGEAMKFANGGGGELSYIVSNIPGLVAQYEYVRVDVPTMQMLNDRFPQLMQQATVEEESMAPSGVRTRARPQTILGTRISRMMETQQAAPEEVELESAPITSGEQPSLMDRIRTTVQSAQSVNPIEDAFKEIGPAITSAVPGLSQYEGQPNPYVEALKSAGLSEDPVAFDPQGLMSPPMYDVSSLEVPKMGDILASTSVAFDPQGLMSPPMYDVSSLEVPKMGDILASEQLISAAPPGVGTMPVTLTSEEIQNAIAPKPEVELPAPVPSEKATADSFSEALSDRPRLADQNSTVRKILDAVFPDQPPIEENPLSQSARDRKAEEDAALKAAEAVPPLSTLEKKKEDLVVAAENTNPAAANDSLTEALRQKFMDRDSDIAPSTVDQLTKEPPKGIPDDDTPDAPKTRKQRMLESVDMISELFGIQEKDKAEDMYDLMATIGFAMASGESPNAMKNIADAFLVGAQMKRADKKEDKKLDQAIKTLAVKDVLEQESDERALEQLLAKEQREEQSKLRLYAEKLRIKEEMDPTSPAGRYLSSELGDAILGIYTDVLKDETINSNDKGAEFFRRAGDKNATQFLALTGFSAMGGGVGSSVTPTESKLDFGESD